MYGGDELRLGLADGVAAAAQGRNAVSALLADAPHSFNYDAMLATSELITNALVHGGGTVELFARFDRQRGRLRVEVSDSSSELPRVVARNWDRIGGLGLSIVAALATEWGTFANGRGKTVWFEMMHSSAERDTERT